MPSSSLRRMTPRCRVCETKMDSDTPRACACGLQVGTVMESKSIDDQFYIVKLAPKTRKRYWAKYNPSSSRTFRSLRRSSYSRRGSRITGFLDGAQTTEYNRLFKFPLVDLLMLMPVSSSSRVYKLVEKMHDRLKEYIKAYIELVPLTVQTTADNQIINLLVQGLTTNGKADNDKIERFVNHLMSTFNASELNKMKKGVTAFFENNRSKILDGNSLKTSDASMYTVLVKASLNK